MDSSENDHHKVFGVRGVRELRITLPDYRGPYAPHDFSDLEVRALDREVAEFLCQSMTPLWGGPRMLVLQIPAAVRNESMELVTKTAYRDIFRRLARGHWHDCTRQFPRAAALVLLGLSVLLASHHVSNLLMEHSLREILSQAVQVGGWVAMWTAFAAVFFQAGDLLRKSMIFRRLARMPIRFEYIGDVVPQEQPAMSVPLTPQVAGARDRLAQQSQLDS